MRIGAYAFVTIASGMLVSTPTRTDRNSELQATPADAPLRMASAADCVQFERDSFGALHQMLGGLPEDERPAVWDEIAASLAQFETEDGFVGPCELLVVTGTK